MEEHELVVQQAMAVVIQALDSPDWRRRAWASDKILSSWLARGHPLAPARGVSGARTKILATAGIDPRQIIFRWRGESGDEADKRDAEAAEAERLRDEDVVSIGWGDGGKTIEHDANPEPSNKD